MNPMYPHTATLWNKVEDGDHATWTRAVLEDVRFEGVQGSRRLANGDGSLDTVRVIVPWRDGCSLDAGDRISQGNISNAEPPENAHHITAVDTISVGTESTHHWEVSGR